MGDYLGSRGYNPLAGMEGGWYGAMLSKVAEIGTLDTIFDEGANAVVPDQASITHEALTDGLTLESWQHDVGNMLARCGFVAYFDPTCMSGPTRNCKKVHPTQNFVSICPYIL